jgi:mono/diheme cytochrome c family protein
MTGTALLPAVILLTAAACLSCSQPADLPPHFDSRVASAESQRAGRELFLRSCALCHGERGDGQGARTSAFATPPRDFTNAAWRRSATAPSVFRVIRDGLPGTAMPGWRALGDDALVDLTAYVLSIRQEK